jgi:dipeptidyl aminopeptidase/acylaminoacyl peptidase
MRTTAMLTLSALLLGFAAPAVVAAEPDLIPRQAFFGNPDRANVRLSPDGARLSYLAAHEGVLNVWVRTIGLDDDRPVTSATTRPISLYFWAMNGDQIIYMQDEAGDENFHVYAVDLDTGERRDLTPFDGVQARITAIDRDHPDELLVSVNNRVPQLHDVWRVNTRTGEREMVFENSDGYIGLQADRDFEIRLASRINARGGMDVFTRDPGNDSWYELVRWGMEDSMNSGPLGLSGDGRTIFLTDSRRSDTGRLYAYHLDGEGGPSYELVAFDDRVDVSDVIFEPRTRRPQAVAFEYTRREWLVLDPSIGDDFEALAEVADGELSITSRDLDDDTWIVAFVRDNGPVAYYLYDRTSREATYLFSNRPELDGLSLARMRPVVVRSRDGFDLVCYLTTPLERRERDLPLVLLVHGGPWGRDSWGYNSLHQWLANRGYAVLSVNFRGSTGFGKRFLNAGNREWAGRMHDDLIDAVNWAVEEKIADPGRVAIMGGSYGGYATLVGLTFTPEYFAAGVDIVGPSHVRTLLESIPPYWEPIRAMFELRVGGLDEPEYLDEISPLTHVQRIARPLLIGQGANDPRVKEAESRQIVEAMQAKSLPVTYVKFPDEGHGFRRPENSLAFFAVTEAFLAEHIGGRLEPITSEIRRSSAQIEVGAELIPGLDGAVD